VHLSPARPRGRGDRDCRDVLAYRGRHGLEHGYGRGRPRCGPSHPLSTARGPSRRMKRAVAVLLVLAVIGIGYNLTRPLSLDDGYECIGWGGAARWLVSEQPRLEREATARGDGVNADPHSFTEQIIRPCGRNAHREINNSWKSPVILGVLLGGAAWFLIHLRRRRLKSPVPEDSVVDELALGTLPPSPPETDTVG